MESNNAKEWLKRAKNNLYRGQDSSYLDYREISLEDLCFDLQQCVEKSFKALLILNNIEFPKTHSISKLIELLQENGINIPEELLESAELTIYAVETRYPLHYQEPVSEKEHKNALQITQKVYNWVEIKIN